MACPTRDTKSSQGEKNSKGCNTIPCVRWVSDSLSAGALRLRAVRGFHPGGSGGGGAKNHRCPFGRARSGDRTGERERFAQSLGISRGQRIYQLLLDVRRRDLAHPRG